MPDFEDLSDEEKEGRIARGFLNMKNHPGMIVLWTGQDLPAGWLWCDGAFVGIEEMYDLYRVLGNEYDSEDGEHFHLPKLEGPAPGFRYIIKY